MQAIETAMIRNGSGRPGGYPGTQRPTEEASSMNRTVKIPDATHPITIGPTGARVTVRIGGVTVAETDKALSLAEANYPVAQYIPLEDVDQSLLDRSTTQTYCPYKGDASYYSVNTPGGTTEADVIWTYEHPYPSVAEIAGHVAFYPDRSEITVG
jgi:uncharacterized protein (DUF427 family)